MRAAAGARSGITAAEQGFKKIAETTRGGSAAAAAENITQVLKTALIGITTLPALLLSGILGPIKAPLRAGILIMLPVLAKTVVQLTLFRIAEHLLGFVDILEFFLGHLVPGIFIGMVFGGHLAIGLFDIIGRRIF